MEFKVTNEWYHAEVRSALVLNYGCSDADAEKLISVYRLDDRLNFSTLYQDHYDPEDVADEIFRTKDRYLKRAGQQTSAYSCADGGLF